MKKSPYFNFKPFSWHSCGANLVEYNYNIVLKLLRLVRWLLLGQALKRIQQWHQSARMCACAYTTIVVLTAQSNNLIYTRSESCWLSGSPCGGEGGWSVVGDLVRSPTPSATFLTETLRVPLSRKWTVHGSGGSLRNE